MLFRVKNAGNKNKRCIATLNDPISQTDLCLYDNFQVVTTFISRKLHTSHFPIPANGKPQEITTIIHKSGSGYATFSASVNDIVIVESVSNLTELWKNIHLYFNYPRPREAGMMLSGFRNPVVQSHMVAVIPGQLTLLSFLDLKEAGGCKHITHIQKQHETLLDVVTDLGLTLTIPKERLDSKFKHRLQDLEKQRLSALVNATSAVLGYILHIAHVDVIGLLDLVYTAIVSRHDHRSIDSKLDIVVRSTKEPLLRAIIEAYNTAETPEDKTQLLAFISPRFCFEDINHPSFGWIKPIKYWAFLQANSHSREFGAGHSGLVLETRKLTYDKHVIDIALEFILSADFSQKYAYGVKTVVHPVTCRDVQLPQVNRKVTIKNIYKAYLEEKGIVGIRLSKNRFYELARVATCTEVKTLYALDSQGVRYGSDNILAGKKIFQELYFLAGKTEGDLKVVLQQIDSIYLHLKSSFITHLQPYSTTAAHCLGNYFFSSVTPLTSTLKCGALCANHGDTCKACDGIQDIQQLMSNVLDSYRISLTPDKLAEYEFRINAFKSNMSRFVGHLVRAGHETAQRNKIMAQLRSMSLGSSLMIIDWKQKILAVAAKESMVNYFGKSGMCLLGTMIYMQAKNDDGEYIDGYTTTVFFTTSEDSTEDSFLVLAHMFSILALVQSKLFCTNIFLFTDGAGCFKGKVTTLCLQKLFAQFGMTLLKHIVGEAGANKSALDGFFAHVAAELAEQAVKGEGNNNIQSAKDLARVLNEINRSGVSTFLVDTDRATNCSQKELKSSALKNISLYSEREYFPNGTIVFREHSGVGVGITVTLEEQKMFWDSESLGEPQGLTYSKISEDYTVSLSSKPVSSMIKFTESEIEKNKHSLQVLEKRKRAEEVRMGKKTILDQHRDAVNGGEKPGVSSKNNHFCTVKNQYGLPCTRTFSSAKLLLNHSIADDNHSYGASNRRSSTTLNTHTGLDFKGFCLLRIIDYFDPSKPNTLLLSTINYLRSAEGSAIISNGSAEDGSVHFIPKLGAARKEREPTIKKTGGAKHFLNWCFDYGNRTKNKLTAELTFELFSIHGTQEGHLKFPEESYWNPNETNTSTFPILERIPAITIKQYFNSVKQARTKAARLGNTNVIEKKTIPQIKARLLANGIVFASNARKKDLLVLLAQLPPQQAVLNNVVVVPDADDTVMDIDDIHTTGAYDHDESNSDIDSIADDDADLEEELQHEFEGMNEQILYGIYDDLDSEDELHTDHDE